VQPAVRRRLWLAAQLVFGAAVVYFAVAELARQWEGAGRELRQLVPRWPAIALSSLVVLATYALLIEAWRRMLVAWSARLSYGDAAHIWFVSNLGRWVPGKVWQIAAMGAMARQRGVAAGAAAGSSIVVNLASIVSGFALVLLTGSAVLDASARGGRGLAVGIVLTVAALLVGVPPLLPRVAALAERLTGRSIPLPRIPVRALWVAVTATAVAWLMYGIAFAVFTRGIVTGSAGSLPGVVPAFVAVYTGSYLAGYLALFAPGGIGVRESVLIVMMPALGLATPAQALVIGLASRLWLTVLEVVPGLLFLAWGPLRRLPRTSDDAAT
jgi:hypothetical protein